MSILSGFKKYKEYLKTDDGYQPLSRWTKSDAVIMGDGTDDTNTLESAFEQLNSDLALIENRTAIADLIAEADKGIKGARIVYCDGSTLNTPYTDGHTTMAQGTAYINMTMGNSPTYGNIIYVASGGSSAPQIFTRSKHNKTWYDWESLALNSDLANYMPNTGQMTRLNAVDLNTVLTPGAYTASNGTTALNYPSGVNGLLLVYQASADRVRQIYFRIGTINSNDMNWYTRQVSSDGATVGSWQKISNYIEVSGTLSSGSTSITLSSDLITTSSTIDVYTDVFGVNPKSITVSAGKVVLTFPSQSSAVNVKVRVS